MCLCSPVSLSSLYVLVARRTYAIYNIMYKRCSLFKTLSTAENPVIREISVMLPSCVPPVCVIERK